MKFYLVGLDLRSETHDYEPVSQALRAMHARKVSHRIWLCVTNHHRKDALTNVYRGLATDDGIIVVEVPETMRLPEAMAMAA